MTPARIRAAIAIGISATIGVLAMILATRLAMLSMIALMMLGMAALMLAGVLLTVALMLRRRRALLVPLMRLDRLRNGRRSECKSRRCGNEKRLHVSFS